VPNDETDQHFAEAETDARTDSLASGDAIPSESEACPKSEVSPAGAADTETEVTSEVHQMADEWVELRLRLDSARGWEASLVGSQFAIVRYFDTNGDARTRLEGWFNSLYPDHVCGSTCNTHSSSSQPSVIRKAATAGLSSGPTG
jgi:hypothetical protein